MDGADKREFDFPVRIARKPAAQADRPLRGDISVALPQREPDIWTDKTTWPFVPSGFLFVPDVLNRVGAAHFGAEWLGIEGIYSGSVSEFPRPKVVFDGDTDVILGREAYEAGKASVASMLHIDLSRRIDPFPNQEWCEASDRWRRLDVSGPLLERRRNEVIDVIHRAAEAGALVFYLKQNGHMPAIKRSAWNVEAEAVRARFRQGSIPAMPAVVRAVAMGGKFIPFFANQAELEAFLGGKDLSDRTGAPGRPTSMPIVEQMMRDRHAAGRMEAGIGAEARVLNQLFASNPDHAGLARPSVKTIENALRAQFRALRSTAAPQKG